MSFFRYKPITDNFSDPTERNSNASAFSIFRIPKLVLIAIGSSVVLLFLLTIIYVRYQEYHHGKVYYIYALRHAEMKYQPLHKCDPPQNPKLPTSIGTCR